jgi:DNA repair protein RecO (recombination protein O)
MHQIKTSALITRSIDWRETSKIITLFCREEGRVDVIVKGARRKNSTYQGITETLNLVEAVIYFSPRRELQVLGNAALENSFQSLRADIEKLAYAFSILELINTFFLNSDSEPVFFDFVIYILQFIGKNTNPEVAFWYFILKLTSYLGFKPQWETCAKCGTQSKYNSIYFSFSSGTILCDKCQKYAYEKEKISSKMISYFKQLQDTHYRNLHYATIPKGSANAYTEFLLEYLRYHTDQKLVLNGLNFLDR